MSNNANANTPSTGDSANTPNSTEAKKVALGTLWGCATELERCEWRDVAQHYDAVLKLEGTTEFKHEDIAKRLEREGWQPKIFNPVIARAEDEDAARILVSLARGI